MGTQFNSRLSAATCSGIRTAVRQARHTIFKKYSPTGRKPQRIVRLPVRAKREFGDAVVSSYVAFAEEYKFLIDLNQSQSFCVTLDWLMRLRSDADFNGFKGIINTYGLESQTNVPGTLKTQLLKTLKGNAETLKDPFRTAASNAAVSVLADTSVSQVSETESLTPAERFGRQLAEKTLSSIVNRFVSAFVRELVMAPLHRSDPNHSDSNLQEAIGLTEDASLRLSQRVILNVERKGKLNSPSDILQMLVSELHIMARRGTQKIA